MHDVAIIGGGIIGTSAAAFLAEAGASVVLFEQAEVAAAASGRNSGVLQHPYDEVLGGFHIDTLDLYRELAAHDDDFDLPTEPAGLLLVSPDEDALAAAASALAASVPELAPTLIPASELARLEPAVAAGIGACRLATGLAVVPGSATHAFARRAVRAGAELRLEGGHARVESDGPRVTGVVTASGEMAPAGAVLVAAGPWTPALVPGWADRPPIERTWGVVATMRLPAPPRAVLEELGIDPAGAGGAYSFSLVTAGGATGVGSTFLKERPEPGALVERLVARAAHFVPAVAGAQVAGVRMCARPVAFDGRPLVGAVAGTEGLYVCAGHGPWGMSIGPATARLVSDEILRRLDVWSSAPELAAQRLVGRET